MLDDHTVPPALEGGPLPLPYDTITLRPSNSAGAPPAPAAYVVADLPSDAHTDAYEITHPDTHPDYWDWAATVSSADIARITRYTANGPITWEPPR